MIVGRSVKSTKMYLTAYTLALTLFHLSEGAVVVTPPNSLTIPVNSLENVTFTCNVTGLRGGEAIWQVQGRQIDDSVISSFADIGIFVEGGQTGVAELTISSAARAVYRTQTPSDPNVVVQCVAFSRGPPPSSVLGDLLSIITYGAPLSPTNLMLTANPENLTELLFSWVAPGNLLLDVEVMYFPSITGLSFNLSGNTSTTSIMFRDDTSLNCQMHTFSVFASNLAGDGPAASITETIPISPDISALNKGFQIDQVSLTDTIAIRLTIPLAQTCSNSFPILNYSLSIISFLDRRQLDFNVNEDPIIRELEIPELELDGIFDVFIETCISIACRQSQPQILRTTDTQAASITFFENNVFMECIFAFNSDAIGCIFQLTLINGTESFFLNRSNSMASQCDQTLNQLGAYISLTASDWEITGVAGVLPIILMPVELSNASSYTTITGCSVQMPDPQPDPQPESSLSGGAIAAIVIAIFIFGVVVVCVVLVVVVYRIKTGEWFKLREKDDDKLTVLFEKELLMGNLRTKTKKKSIVSTSGQNFQSHGGELVPANDSMQAHDRETAAISLASPRTLPCKLDFENTDSNQATNPNSAFTLDISSDRRKVRLHLNRALIKRVIQDKNLNTMDQRKTRRLASLSKQQSVPNSKQHLLPLQCEVRVEVEEENQ